MHITPVAQLLFTCMHTTPDALCTFVILTSAAQFNWFSTPCLFICAGLSTLWMGAGWNYYTVYSKADEPSIDTRSVAY